MSHVSTGGIITAAADVVFVIALVFGSIIDDSILLVVPRAGGGGGVSSRDAMVAEARSSVAAFNGQLRRSMLAAKGCISRRVLQYLYEQKVRMYRGRVRCAVRAPVVPSQWAWSAYTEFLAK